MLRRIGLVTLVVRDYDEAIRFYVDALGFTLIEDTPQGDKRWVVVAPESDSGGPSLLLARAIDGDQSSRIGNQTGGRVALFLETDDFERDFQRMTSAGVTFLEEPRHEAYGSVAVFQDCYGNKWDLLQRA